MIEHHYFPKTKKATAPFTVPWPQLLVIVAVDFWNKVTNFFEKKYLRFSYKGILAFICSFSPEKGNFFGNEILGNHFREGSLYLYSQFP